MKKTIYIVLISFVSGMGGSWFYQTKLQKSKIDVDHATVQSIAHQDSGQKNTPKSMTGNFTAAIESPTTKDQAFDPSTFILASKAGTPCVVYIKTITQNAYGSSWMDWFFGGGTGQSISSGSGVIYTQDGYIITNNHVVDDADKISVIIGKKAYDAALVGADPATDIAVLKIDADQLKAIKVGSSRDVEVGQWVIAIGNPFNLTSTVTAGIVSAKGRELNINKSIFPIESFIQTDAAINPGNSGGALVNLKGELVGINSAILSKTGTYAGYGFAVPSDIVKKVVDDIIKYGEVQKAFFGAEVMDIDSDIANKLDLDDLNGVVVSYLQKEGAAANADIRKGDIILKIDNTPVDSRSQFEEVLSYHSPGDKIQVVYKRNQKIISKSLTLTNKEGTTDKLKRTVFTSRKLGADLEKVSKVERNLLDIDYGVRILKVRNGLIRQMELQEGFIITSINQIAIKDPETLTDILTKVRGRVYLQGVNKRGQKEMYRYYF